MLYRAPVDTSLVTEGVTLVKHRLLLLLLLLLLCKLNENKDYCCCCCCCIVSSSFPVPQLVNRVLMQKILLLSNGSRKNYCENNRLNAAGAV